MGYNKFIKKDGTELLDLTQDNITEADVLNGKTFHDKTGDKKTGTAVATEEWDGTFTVTGEPTTDGGSGGTGSNTFTFKIGGTEYTAEAGMSWEQWVNSEYNTIGAYVSNGVSRVYYKSNGLSYYLCYNINNTSYYVRTTDGIVSTTQYHGAFEGGGAD